MSDQIVTRFAPSPTGHLHIGGARTAIFSWLLARSQGGKFLLRIEDTDRERSQDEMTQAILDAMSWLGLDTDGEPVYQSERFDLYNKYIDQLLDEGKAYWCECTPDEVNAMREEARAKGLKPKYNGRCRERGLAAPSGDEKRVVRFKTPLDGKIVFTDMVRGSTAWDNAELDDMILRRPDGSPTYNLAVVVDDALMGVTHVIRGDDHVNNTPRQIHLYEALGFPVPEFGHVPLIHGKDKKKLSKRHGARSVMEYRTDGYLADALLNYLVRLGWSCGDQELFSREELLKLFTTDNFSKSPAAFDPDKLDWVNAQYIKEAAPAALAPLLAEFLAEVEVPGVKADDDARTEAVIPLYQPRATTMKDMAAQSAFFFQGAADIEYDEKAVNKFLTEEAREHVAALRERLAALPGFAESDIEGCLAGYVEEKELKFKVIAQPVRVSLSGKTVSPGLYETMAVLGREETLARLDRALAL